MEKNAGGRSSASPGTAESGTPSVAFLVLTSRRLLASLDRPFPHVDQEIREQERRQDVAQFRREGRLLQRFPLQGVLRGAESGRGDRVVHQQTQVEVPRLEEVHRNE